MRFLIDGYNLLHAVWPAEGRHLPAQAWPRFRQRLLDRLWVRYGPEDAATVTVVFDAAHAPPGAPAEQDCHGIHVRFAIGYPAADDLIEELIRAETVPARLTVVSDDHRLQRAAQRRGCAVASCLDYFESVEHPPQPKPAEALPAKPDTATPDEVDRWLQAFGEAESDLAKLKPPDKPPAKRKSAAQQEKEHWLKVFGEKKKDS